MMHNQKGGIEERNSNVSNIGDVMGPNMSIDAQINNIIDELDQKKESKSKSDYKCAPGLKYEAGSCAKLYVLIELAKAYNLDAKNEDDKIKLSTNIETLNPTKYKLYLVHEINKRVGDKCTTQKCWSQQEFIKNMEKGAFEEFSKYTFRPNSPQGQFAWLSTFNINATMAQYERKYGDFRFFGAVPIDFADLPELEASNIDYDYYIKNGIKKMGIIFNLDEHYKKGSHWVALYTDFEKFLILYFDSFAVKAGTRVRKLGRQQCEFMIKMGISCNKIRSDYNKIQHQRKNSECGVYSMNFLIRMARGDDFDEVCKNVISDERINQCRRVYFDEYHADGNNR